MNSAHQEQGTEPRAGHSIKPETNGTYSMADAATAATATGGALHQVSVLALSLEHKGVTPVPGNSYRRER